MLNLGLERLYSCKSESLILVVFADIVVVVII